MRLGEADTRAALFCAAEMLRTYRRGGRPVPAWLRALHDRLDLHVRASADGHESSGAAEQSDTELIDTSEAARILGCTPRHTRRLAADLDARHLAGRWLYPKRTVLDYAEAKAKWQATQQKS